MKPMLVDTDILSRYFRSDQAVVTRFGSYVERHGAINLSIIAGGR